jgi:hypothetical protein
MYDKYVDHSSRALFSYLEVPYYNKEEKKNYNCGNRKKKTEITTLLTTT